MKNGCDDLPQPNTAETVSAPSPLFFFFFFFSNVLFKQIDSVLVISTMQVILSASVIGR